MFIVSPTKRINLNEGIQYQFQGGELGNETEEGRRESGGEMGEEAPFPHPSPSFGYGDHCAETRVPCCGMHSFAVRVLCGHPMDYVSHRQLN